MQKAGSLVVQGAHGLHPQQTRYFNATEIRWKMILRMREQVMKRQCTAVLASSAEPTRQCQGVEVSSFNNLRQYFMGAK